MNTLLKTARTSVLLLFGLLASGAAMAQHHGHGHGGGVRIGFYLGTPLYRPAYYPSYYSAYYPPPYYYYRPAPVVYTAPPVYVEQRVVQAAPAQAQGDWFYCAASRTYYPYAQECPSGWQRVPAQPSSR